MELCKYGCGKEAKFTLKNGAKCCSKSSNSCPEVRKKISISTKKKNYFKVDINKVKVSCQYCNKEVTAPNIGKHENYCYLNPKNIKYCPVCGSIIKNRGSTTCSYSCSNTFFRSGKDNGQWNGNNYRLVCKQYHSLKCIICEEEIFVHVHHLDENRSNNSPENLIPLCILHHTYAHSEYKYLIEEEITKYIEFFKKEINYV